MSTDGDSAKTHKADTHRTDAQQADTHQTDTQTAGTDAAKTYEQARDELAQVVAKLEAGGLGLDESLALWERGEQLAVRCGRFLEGARERVEAALAAGHADPPRRA